MVLGGSGVGKTAIVSQFLYDSFVSVYKVSCDWWRAARDHNAHL